MPVFSLSVHHFRGAPLGPACQTGALRTSLGPCRRLQGRSDDDRTRLMSLPVGVWSHTMNFRSLYPSTPTDSIGALWTPPGPCGTLWGSPMTIWRDLCHFPLIFSHIFNVGTLDLPVATVFFGALRGPAGLTWAPRIPCRPLWPLPGPIRLPYGALSLSWALWSTLWILWGPSMTMGPSLYYSPRNFGPSKISVRSVFRLGRDAGTNKYTNLHTYIYIIQIYTNFEP